MTKEEAKALGYEVIKASAFEVGLCKGERGIRSWFCQDFDRRLPPLDHPKILEAIAIHEDYYTPPPPHLPSPRHHTGGQIMPGLKENELMHEWMEEDSPEYDIEPERIMLELVRDNELMLQLIRECGKEDELRNRIISIGEQLKKVTYD